MCGAFRVYTIGSKPTSDQTHTSNVNLVKLGGKTIKEFKPSKSKPYFLAIQEPKCGKNFFTKLLDGGMNIVFALKFNVI